METPVKEEYKCCTPEHNQVIMKDLSLSAICKEESKEDELSQEEKSVIKEQIE